MTEFELSEKEMQIVDLVTAAFPGASVKAFPIEVETLEGDESATLRFTLDDAASTDIKRNRIAEEDPESLAAETERELQRQAKRVQ